MMLNDGTRPGKELRISAREVMNPGIPGVQRLDDLHSKKLPEILSEMAGSMVKMNKHEPFTIVV